MDNIFYLNQLTTAVRKRAQEIFETSVGLVTIDADRYQSLRAELANWSHQPDPAVLSDYDQHLSPERRTGLKLFFGVVNYCFVQPYTRLEYPYRSNSGRLVKRATGFYAALAESGLEWEQIETIGQASPAQWHLVLQTDREADLFQLDARLDRLRQFSAYLNNQGLRRVNELFTRYPDAGSLLRLLVESGLFEDELLKRAQLTVYMLNPGSRELAGQDIPGLDRFTVMADYRLPQVFYNQGALKITDPRLLETLQNHQVIESGSPYERALRAGTIILGQRLAVDMHIAECDVDHLLWELSQTLVNTGKMAIPHMLVPTDMY